VGFLRAVPEPVLIVKIECADSRLRRSLARMKGSDMG